MVGIFGMKRLYRRHWLNVDGRERLGKARLCYVYIAEDC